MDDFELNAEETKAFVATDQVKPNKSILACYLKTLLVIGGFSSCIFVLLKDYQGKKTMHESSVGDMVIGDEKSSQTTGKAVNKNKTSFHGLDVFLIGFPKCGTGTIRDLFAKSDEILMLGHENGDLFRKGSSERAFSMLESNFETLIKYGQAHQRRQGHHPMPLNASTTSSLKRAVKNPNGVHDMIAIKRLVKHTDRDTKLIVGLRHPITYYQSYCNFHIGRLSKQKPNNSFTFKDCEKLYLHKTRFDIYLKQLSKVSITKSEKDEMKDYEHRLEVVANPYQVFLYHLEQISDKNITRSQKFKSEFQEYLQLKTPISSWPKNKLFHETVAEEINICDENFDDLRQKILVNSRIASTWMQKKFMKSRDVIIGGSSENFMEILNSWHSDACQ